MSPVRENCPFSWWTQRDDRALFAKLKAYDYEAKAIAPLLSPFLRPILASSLRSKHEGNLSLDLEDWQSAFFEWMISSKEWQHLESLWSGTAPKCSSLPLLLSRSITRYLFEKSKLTGDAKTGSSDPYASFFRLFDSSIDALDNNTQLCLQLYFEGLTEEEIAQITGLDTNSVCKTISIGRSDLQESIKGFSAE